MQKLQPWQQAFIDLALQEGVLRFGDFSLKSGRQSPYFFNAGLFYKSTALAALGQYYAEAIQNSGVAFDILFGPAYKGIPLATTTALALAERRIDASVAFHRKEIKDHGEGGQLWGAPLAGKKILLIDDVITAGTAIGECVPLIQAAGGQLVGVVIALDREERGQGEHSAIADVQQKYAVPVFSLINLTALLTYLETNLEFKANYQRLLDYRQMYGV